MAFLIILRLFTERNYRQLRNIIFSMFGFGIIAVIVFLFFASPKQYIDALAFSSGYGVGAALFSSITGPLALLFIYSLYYIGFISPAKFKFLTNPIIVIFLMASSVLVVGAGIVTGYSPRSVFVLSMLGALFYIKSLIGNKNIDNIRRSNWLVFCILTFATTLGVTSGNGFGQSTGAFMVGLPLLIMQLELIDSNENVFNLSSRYLIALILLPILFVALWSRSPYREAGWWRTNQPLNFIPSFAFLNTTQDRSNFLFRMKQVLQPITESRQTLLLGEFPIFYIIADIKQATCMLYMHSLTSDKSEKSLRECMSNKYPEVVIDIHTNKDISISGSRIKLVMYDIIKPLNYRCESKDFIFDSNGINNPSQINFNFCH